jgi:hypothetical protein
MASWALIDPKRTSDCHAHDTLEGVRLDIENTMRSRIAYSDPAALLASAEREMEPIPHEALFNDSQYQKLTERWCAGMLGIGYSKFVAPCEVSVNESAHRLDIDLYLRTARCEYEFQLAEVQEEGRLRGLEYKQLAAGNRRTVPYTPERGRLEGSKWLAEGVRKKAQKRYAGSASLHLLLYANFSARKIEHNEIAAMLAPFSMNFASIWIITSLHVCSIFSPSEMGEIGGWGEVRTLQHY